MKHTRQDLKIMQGWSLERKIRVTQTRIMEWYGVDLHRIDAES